jgi:transcriptional regulator with XRE-family HTH domain
MSKLQDLIQERMRAKSLTARAIAERSGISYPTVLAVVNEGRVPRKPEHRESLRAILDVPAAAWASAIAASQKGGIDLPGDGPLDLQQLLTKLLLEQGLTEQSFAKASGIAYPTLMGITRKGSIPRGDTLPRLAKALGIPLAELETAAGRSRSGRRDDDEDEPAGDDGAAQPASAAAVEEPPRLPALVAAAVERSGLSTAAFARERGVPYLTLSRLINMGEMPTDADILGSIAAAAGLDRDDLDAAMRPTTTVVRAAPAPAAVHAPTPAPAPAAAIAPRPSATERAASAQDELAEMTALFTRLPADSRHQLVVLLRTLVR